MTNEVETQGREDAQELNLNDLDVVTGGASSLSSSMGFAPTPAPQDIIVVC